MAEAIGIILLTMLVVGGGGLAIGEVIARIDSALIRRKVAKQEAAERQRAYWTAAVEAAQRDNQRHTYVAYDRDGQWLFVSPDVAEALKVIVGKQGAYILKDGRKVAQNRTLVQGGGKK